MSSETHTLQRSANKFTKSSTEMCARHQVSLPYPSTAQHPPSSPTHPVSSILPDLHPDGLFTTENMHVTWLARSLLAHVDVRPLRKIAQ